MPDFISLSARVWQTDGRTDMTQRMCALRNSLASRGKLRSTLVQRRSLMAGELSLSCAQPAVDG